MTPWLLAALAAAAPPIKGRPDDFIGAVGKFTLSAEIRPSRFRLDESATLTLKLDGAGDVSQVRTPDLSRSKPFAERFDVVGPASRKVEKDGVLFNYPIRARTVEVKAVPSIRVSIYEESPPRPQYRLLRTPEIPVEIIPVPAKDASPPPATESPVAGPTFGSWTPIAVVVAVVVVALWFMRPAPRKPLEISTASQTKRRRGKPIDKPAEFVRNDSERWIDELAEALSLPIGKRTSAEVLAAAKQVGLRENFFEELKQNLDALDASRFGGAAAALNENELRSIKSEIQRTVSENTPRSAAPTG